MEIPTTKNLCDAERFAEGLKILARECNVTNVEYNRLGSIIKMSFADGSHAGGAWLFIEAGYFRKEYFE